MTLSMCLIAKNERENIRPCLESFADHVDEIVFVDTGSRDGTVAEVRRVCSEHSWTDKLLLGRFRWQDDFAAARNYAHDLASGDWHCWVDAGDRVSGAHHLRQLVADVAPSTIEVIAPYRRSHANSLNESWKLRLFRPDAARWIFPVCEIPRPYSADALQNVITTGTVRWDHRRRNDTSASSFERNGRILRRWARSAPTNLQAAYYCAAWLSAAGRRSEAEAVLRRQHRSGAMNGDWPCDPFLRAQSMVFLGELVAERGGHAEARRLATAALKECPDHTSRAWLLLANLAAYDGEWERVMRAARAGLADCEEDPSTPADLVLGLVHARERFVPELCEVLVGAACRLRRPKDAREDVRQAMTISDDPRMPRLWGLLREACGERVGRMPPLSAILGS